MTAIFISHRSTDNIEAQALKDWLAQQGHERLFLDFDPEVGIPAGVDWERRLHQELRRCQAILIILTPDWLASKWCWAELAIIREKGKAVFVVRVKPCVDGPVIPAIQEVDLTVARDAGLTKLARGLKEYGLDPASAFDWKPGRPIYPGLAAFDIDDAAIFFGRSEESWQAVEALRRLRLQATGSPKLLLITGASGSGKSSLLRAGVLARLRKEPASWIVAKPFRRGADALVALAEAIAWALPPDRRLTNLKAMTARLTGEDGAGQTIALARELRLALDRPEATLVLALDQAEELLATERGDDAARLLDLFRTALAAVGNEILVIATIRSDRLAGWQEHASIKATAEHGALPFEMLPLGPMPMARLGEIVRGPAAYEGLRIDEDLVDAIRNDTATPDALPLLAYTLQYLYRHFADDGRLTLVEYRSFGGLEGSVRSQADAAIPIDRLGQEDRRALHEAFVPGLVRAAAEGGFSRGRALLGTLPPRAAPHLRRMIDEARLLTTDSDSQGGITVEVAHESLLRVWPTLARWIAEDAESLRRLEALQRAAADWAQAERNEGFLIHRDHRLADAEALTAEQRFAARLDGPDRDYLAACRDAQNRREAEAKATRERELRAAQELAEEQKAKARRTRFSLVVVGVLAIVAAGLGIWGFNSARETQSVAEASKVWNQFDFRSPERTTSEVQGLWTLAGDEAIRTQAAQLLMADPALAGRYARGRHQIERADGLRCVLESSPRCAFGDAAAGALAALVRSAGETASPEQLLDVVQAIAALDMPLNEQQTIVISDGANRLLSAMTRSDGHQAPAAEALRRIADMLPPGMAEKVSRELEKSLVDKPWLANSPDVQVARYRLAVRSRMSDPSAALGWLLTENLVGDNRIFAPIVEDARSLSRTMSSRQAVLALPSLISAVAEISPNWEARLLDVGAIGSDLLLRVEQDDAPEARALLLDAISGRGGTRDIVLMQLANVLPRGASPNAAAAADRLVLAARDAGSSKELKQISLALMSLHVPGNSNRLPRIVEPILGRLKAASAPSQSRDLADAVAILSPSMPAGLAATVLETLVDRIAESQKEEEVLALHKAARSTTIKLDRPQAEEALEHVLSRLPAVVSSSANAALAWTVRDLAVQVVAEKASNALEVEVRDLAAGIEEKDVDNFAEIVGQLSLPPRQAELEAALAHWGQATLTKLHPVTTDALAIRIAEIVEQLEQGEEIDDLQFVAQAMGTLISAQTIEQLGEWSAQIFPAQSEMLRSLAAAAAEWSSQPQSPSAMSRLIEASKALHDLQTNDLGPMALATALKTAVDTVGKEALKNSLRSFLARGATAQRPVSRRLSDTIVRATVKSTDIEGAAALAEALRLLPNEASAEQMDNVVSKLASLLGGATEPTQALAAVDVIRHLPRSSDAALRQALPHILEATRNAQDAKSLGGWVSVVSSLHEYVDDASFQMLVTSAEELINRSASSSDARAQVEVFQRIMSLRRDASSAQEEVSRVREHLSGKLRVAADASSILDLAEALRMLPDGLRSDRSDWAIRRAFKVSVVENDLGEVEDLTSAVISLSADLSDDGRKWALLASQDRLAGARSEPVAKAWAGAVEWLASSDNTYFAQIAETLKYPTVAGKSTDLLLSRLRIRFLDDRRLGKDLAGVVAWLERNLTPDIVFGPAVRPKPPPATETDGDFPPGGV